MKNNNRTWFTKWFLNNKVTVVLLNVLLIFLIIAMFVKVGYVFNPIMKMLGIILPPIVVAGVLYYLINPLIDYLETKYSVKRVVSIAVVFIIVFIVLVAAIISLIPVIQSQATSLVNNFPKYWNQNQKMINDFLQTPTLRKFHLADKLSTDKIYQMVGNSIGGIFDYTLGNLSSAVGVVTNVVMIVLTAPFVLFFMLKDDDKIKPSILQFVPTKIKQSTSEVLTEINTALSSYIRGQLTVAFWVAVMFAIGYLFIGMPYGLLLGIFAGLCNLIPYVGSAVGLIPAFILAMLTGDGMWWKVIIVFLVEQTIETRVISPLVMGSKMNMHPVTTIFVLLISGGMFGLVGVIAGIPIYAILKILFLRFFGWVKRNSVWYEDDPAQITAKGPNTTTTTTTTIDTKSKEKNK